MTLGEPTSDVHLYGSTQVSQPSSWPGLDAGHGCLSLMTWSWYQEWKSIKWYWRVSANSRSRVTAYCLVLTQYSLHIGCLKVVSGRRYFRAIRINGMNCYMTWSVETNGWKGRDSKACPLPQTKNAERESMKDPSTEFGHYRQVLLFVKPMWCILWVLVWTLYRTFLPSDKGQVNGIRCLTWRNVKYSTVHLTV